MKNLYHSSKYILSTIALLLLLSGNVSAQNLRTAFFMENTTINQLMNPGSLPYRGYVSIPSLDGFGMSYQSNDFSINNLIYSKGNSYTTFMDNSVSAGGFLGGLKNRNAFNLDNYLPIVGAGWYDKRKNFWSFGVAMKTNAGVDLPKELFKVMKQGIDLASPTLAIPKIAFNARSTGEVYVGYTHQIIEGVLSVGGRMKFIAGFLDVETQIDRVSATIAGTKWAMEAKGEAILRAKGAQKKYQLDDTGNEYISGISFDGFGLSGWGLGVDVGATFRPIKGLTVSASLIDLGFINWSEGSTLSGAVDGSYVFDKFEQTGNTGWDNQIGHIKSDLMEFFHLQDRESKSAASMLYTTLNLGVEYAILNNKLGFGLLSSTQFFKPETYSELTFSINGRPLSWLSAAVSYSFIYNRLSSFGMLINIHAKYGINLYVASDYLITKFKKGMPQFSDSFNFSLGIAVPLGRSRD